MTKRNIVPLAERLRRELKDRQEKRSQYSMRAFARDLQLNSSVLSRILNDKLPLTKKLVARIATNLPLSEQDYHDYLKALMNRKEIKKMVDIDRVDLSVLNAPIRSLDLHLEAQSIEVSLVAIEDFLKKISNEAEGPAHFNLRVLLYAVS